jgi:para-nitrobenzyl esterase
LYGDVANQWFSDTLFRCNAVVQAAWHQAAHHPTYEYQMEHATPGRPPQMAVHSGELPYVFGFYPTSGYMGGAYTDADHKLAQQIEQYWTNFARTGNPNGEGLPNWPEFGGTKAYIRFTQGGDEESAAGLRRPQCDLYRQELSFTQ